MKRRRKGKAIKVPLTYHLMNHGGGGSWSALTDAEKGAIQSFMERVRDHFFARSPFARFRENIEGRRIAADLVPHFDSSWRPLAAREMWRKP